MIDAYLKWVDSSYHFSESTKKAYRYWIRRVDLENLPQFLLKLRSNKSDKTFNLCITVLKSFGKFLKERDPNNELIPIIEQLDPIRNARSHSHPPYSEKEVREILNKTKGWKRIAIVLGLYAGLRRNEIRSLNMEDIDLENNILTVWEGKGAKSRLIPISQPLKLELKRWMSFRKAVPSGTDSLLLSNRGSRPILGSGEVLKRLSNEVGFKVSWHRLRSTFATQIYRKTKDVKLVQNLLGHSNSQVTDRYIRITLQEMQESINKLGDIYE